MKMRIRILFPYLLCLTAALYLGEFAGMFAGLPVAVALLYVVNPVLCMGVCLVFGLRGSYGWYLPSLAALLFLPAVFIFHNHTALFVVPAYAVMGFLGLTIGWLMRKILSPAANSKV